VERRDGPLATVTVRLARLVIAAAIGLCAAWLAKHLAIRPAVLDFAIAFIASMATLHVLTRTVYRRGDGPK
jgi:hypothetical protein